MNTEMNTAEEQTDFLKAIIDEDQLDLEMSPVEKDTAAAEIEACNDYLEIVNRPVNHQISEIPARAINTLYNAAMQLRVNTLNFVTGLKLNLAVDDDDLITLLYQPVFMTTPPSALSEPFYDVTEGDFYAYDPARKSFRPVTQTDADRLTGNYQSQIRIKHRTETSFHSFVPNVDTIAAIFPFQTIYALLADNKASSVFFHNSIRKEPAGGSYSIKHCLLLSSQSLQINSFAGKFANRSHLCPPSCNSVQYALIKI